MRVFSGIQPTGWPHIGNYLGALRRWVQLQDQPQCRERFYCIVDLHAFTTMEPFLKNKTREMAMALLACGLDPQRSTLFIQSAVPEHAQLAWLLACVTPFGLLNRMTQWKSKGLDRDRNKVGLFSYPILQAADITLYDATHVPVGADQRQHLELTRMLVDYFNKQCNQQLLQKPNGIFEESALRIMSLKSPERKMSKSDDDRTRINLIDAPDVIAAKIKKAVTDSIPGISYDPERRPAVKNLLDLYAACSDEPVQNVCLDIAQLDMPAFKQRLTEAIVEHLRPIQQRLSQLERDPLYVDRVLDDGAAKAKMYARAKYAQIHEAVLHLKRSSDETAEKKNVDRFVSK